MKPTAFLAALCALLLAGCYHPGTPYGEVPASIGELHVGNQSEEPACAGYVTQSIRSRAATDPAFTLKDSFPQYDIDITLTDVEQAEAVSAKTRDKESSKSSQGSAYQTVVYRVILHARVVVTKLGDDKPCIQKDYAGEADFPRMHDHDLSKQAALQQAAHHLSELILNDITALTAE